MTEWLVSVFSTVFIVSFLSIVLPEGRLKKFVKPLISLVVIIIIVAPLLKEDCYTENLMETNSIEIKEDENFLDYIITRKIDLYTKNCIKIAEKNGINDSEILIEYSVDENDAINISDVILNLKNAVITSNDEHIVILQRVKEEISEYLGIDKVKVKIYE